MERNMTEDEIQEALNSRPLPIVKEQKVDPKEGEVILVRNRPLERLAVQFTQKMAENETSLLPEGIKREPSIFKRFYVPTLEGPFHITPGYWVLTGLKGEHWAVRDDIFKETYEVIDK